MVPAGNAFKVKCLSLANYTTKNNSSSVHHQFTNQIKKKHFPTTENIILEQAQYTRNLLFLVKVEIAVSMYIFQSHLSFVCMYELNTCNIS